MRNAEINVEDIEAELASFGPIYIDGWIDYGKEVVKPGLGYSKDEIC